MAKKLKKGAPEGRRRVMSKFGLSEVSFVNRPAQSPAVAQIMKAKISEAGVGTLLDDQAWLEKQEGEQDAQKAGDLVHMATGEAEGHQHAISFHSGGDSGDPVLIVQYAQGGEDERAHDHQIVRASDGTFSVTANAGHTHTLDSEELQRQLTAFIMKGDTNPAGSPPVDSGKSDSPDGNNVGKGETEMPEVNPEQDALKAQVAALTAIAALSGVQKAHYDTLADEAQKADFLKMDEDAKSEAIEAVSKAEADSDPVVYKAHNGDEFRKSDDPRLIKMAKERDEERKENIRLQKAAENERFEKAAETDLGHMSGDVKTRAAILKAVDSIKSDDLRKAALDALKSQNAKMAGAFTSLGHAGAPSLEKSGDSESANAELEKLAKAKASADNIDFYEAYDKVSDENPDLLAKALG